MNKKKIFLFMVLGVLLLTGFKNDAYADSVESQAGDIPISSIEFLDKNLDVKEVYSEDVLLNTVSNGIVTPMADDTRIETRLVTKYYDGRYTVDGQSYNYSLRVRVIYDCEISPGSIRMSGIRNIDSSAGDGAVLELTTKLILKQIACQALLLQCQVLEDGLLQYFREQQLM